MVETENKTHSLVINIKKQNKRNKIDNTKLNIDNIIVNTNSKRKTHITTLIIYFCNFLKIFLGKTHTIIYIMYGFFFRDFPKFGSFFKKVLDYIFMLPLHIIDDILS